ncbi:ribonuclease III family protein [Streptomyces sp. NPDC057245]|uniref:ribonuclease III family protein n=1 Tax=Streptomyces sp. NPDC057245 TaxID=3346065 RepID=UPI0036451522
MASDRFASRYWAALMRIGPPRPWKNAAQSESQSQEPSGIGQRYVRRLLGRAPTVPHRLGDASKDPTGPSVRPAEPPGAAAGDRGLEELSAALGVSVDPSILARALAQESYAEAHGLPSNEALEALGDAVLGMVATETIYRNHPDLTKGELPRLRARMVNTRTLARIARGIGLGPHLRISVGEELSGGRDRAETLADALEAVVGAVCDDQGLDAAAGLVHRLFDPQVELAGTEQTAQGDRFTDSSAQTSAGTEAEGP